jgi:hypothetical protein
LPTLDGSYDGKFGLGRGPGLRGRSLIARCGGRDLLEEHHGGKRIIKLQVSSHLQGIHLRNMTDYCILRRGFLRNSEKSSFSMLFDLDQGLRKRMERHSCSEEVGIGKLCEIDDAELLPDDAEHD